MIRLRPPVVAALAAGTATALGLGWTSGERAVGTSATRTTSAAGVSRPPAERSLRDTPALPVSAAGSLTVRRAYAGVSCRRANWIGCDQIGLAVWLRRGGFERVRARVGDRVIALRRGRDGLWSGQLHDAGLRDGTLRVPATPTGRWVGFDPPTVRAVLDVARADGIRASTVVATPLRAGWG